MSLYSKNGSIPYPTKDDTDGWVEVPEPPVPGLGEETVWWCPPGWVTRPIEPAPVEGYIWKWSQSETEWVSYQIEPEPGPEPEPPAPSPAPEMPSGNVTI